MFQLLDANADDCGTEAEFDDFCIALGHEGCPQTFIDAASVDGDANCLSEAEYSQMFSDGGQTDDGNSGCSLYAVPFTNTRTLSAA